MRPPPLGAVLAGGESRRYGSPKALAAVAGIRIIDRVIDALGSVTPDLIVSANEPELFEDLGLPLVPDERPGLGALGGIHAALTVAREAGRPGVVAVACDMPFPCVPLLEDLRAAAFPDPIDSGPGSHAVPAPAAGPTAAPDVVIPESRGRRGVEPLCAAYGIGCLPAIEAALDAGDHRMIGFHDRVRVVRVSLADVESLCDVQRAFLNVNTPEDRDRAEALANEDGRSR